jgi:hypothetical protein
MRCLGVSTLGNQCQNNAGKDGLCRNHRGQPVRPKAPQVTLVCKVCCDTLKVRKSVARSFDEKPGYYLCNVCVKVYKHERTNNSILVHHGSLGRFSAFTVRKPSEDEAEAVLRAKALVAQVSWPDDYGDV